MLDIRDHGGNYGGRSPNLKPENIKEGVNISGVLGEYSKRPKFYRGGSGINYPPHFLDLTTQNFVLSKDGNYVFAWVVNTSTKIITRRRYNLNRTLLDSTVTIDFSAYTNIGVKPALVDGQITIRCNASGVYTLRRYNEDGVFLGESVMSASNDNALSQNVSVNRLGDYAFGEPNTNAKYYIYNSSGTQLYMVTHPLGHFPSSIYWLSDKHVLLIQTNNMMSYFSYTTANQWQASWEQQDMPGLAMTMLKLMLSNYGSLLN